MAPDEVTLRLGEREATFEVGGVRLTTRLIEGEFPNYRGLIPSSHPNRLTVGREPLIDAVRRVKLLAREPNTPVRLAMSADGLELVAITQDVGQAHEQLDAGYEGTELTVAFNPEYLLNGVEVTPGDEISLETVDAQKPAVIRSTGGPGVPLPADAGPGLLMSRALARVADPSPLAHRLPQLRDRRGVLPRGSPRSSARTARARPTCSRPSPTWPH